MLRTPEILREFNPTPININKKIIAPERLNQPGTQIALKFIEILNIPIVPLSSYNSKNLQNERIIAENLTNKATITPNGIISHDPRLFLGAYPDLRLLTAMEPKVADIFKNEFNHYEDKKDTKDPDKLLRQVIYTTLPGNIPCFLKGFQHDKSWQKEHGEYLAKTAKNAQVICIESFPEKKIGDSLKHYWEKNLGHYDTLMRKTVQKGFNGLFAQIDMRDHSKIALDNITSFNLNFFPDLPDKFFLKYFDYIKKIFPEDKPQIENSQKLKEILKKASTTMEGLNQYNRPENIQNIITYPSVSVDKNLRLQQNQLTSLEYGEKNFSDAMSAIKLHLIANEMRENRIEKGIIVDFKGSAHTESTYSFLTDPLRAMETIIRSPHLALIEKLAKKDDVSSIYPAFSPNQEMFKEMLKQIWKLELAYPEKGLIRRWAGRGPWQMPLKKFEITDRDKILNDKLEKLNIPVFH